MDKSSCCQNDIGHNVQALILGIHGLNIYKDTPMYCINTETRTTDPWTNQVAAKMTLDCNKQALIANDSLAPWADLFTQSHSYYWLSHLDNSAGKLLSFPGWLLGLPMADTKS